MNDKHRWDNDPQEYNYTEYRRVDNTNRIVAKVYRSGLRGEWVYGSSFYLSQEDAISACEKDFPTEAETPAQPQYREPTPEDAGEFRQIMSKAAFGNGSWEELFLGVAKQLNFVRKVQP